MISKTETLSLAYLLNILQYEKMGDGTEKTELLQHITETMLHRERMDFNINMIGAILFGPENGPSLLKTVREQGLPLTDDWDCLKSMVNLFMTVHGCYPHTNSCLTKKFFWVPGPYIRGTLWLTDSIWHETYASICKHMQPLCITLANGRSLYGHLQ